MIFNRGVILLSVEGKYLFCLITFQEDLLFTCALYKLMVLILLRPVKTSYLLNCSVHHHVRRSQHVCCTLSDIILKILYKRYFLPGGIADADAVQGR